MEEPEAGSVLEGVSLSSDEIMVWCAWLKPPHEGTTIGGINESGVHRRSS